MGAKLAKANQAWADDAETAWDRIKALGWLSVSLAVIGLIVAWKLFGTKKVLGDAVALQSQTEQWAVEAGHNAAELGAKVKAWWGGDKNEAVVQAVKTDILRQ